MGADRDRLQAFKGVATFGTTFPPKFGPCRLSKTFLVGSNQSSILFQDKPVCTKLLGAVRLATFFQKHFFLLPLCGLITSFVVPDILPL